MLQPTKFPIHFQQSASLAERASVVFEQTIGTPRMLVLDAYRMGYLLEPQESSSRLTVYIDYALPSRGLARWVGRMAGAAYARWCVTSMIEEAVRSFGSGDASASPKTSHRSAS